MYVLLKSDRRCLLAHSAAGKARCCHGGRVWYRGVIIGVVGQRIVVGRKGKVVNLIPKFPRQSEEREVWLGIALLLLLLSFIMGWGLRASLTDWKRGHGCLLRGSEAGGCLQSVQRLRR
jgi:hypothetical protein